MPQGLQRDARQAAGRDRPLRHHRKGHLALGMAAMYVGDPDQGRDVMRPLKNLGPAVDLIQPMPYTAFQALLDPTAPEGNRSYWRGEYLEDLSDEAIAILVRHAPALVAATTRTFREAMRPFTTGGAYLNFTPEDRVRDAYGAAKYARLVDLKGRYDPDNLFRLNQNIKPGRREGRSALT